LKQLVPLLGLLASCASSESKPPESAAAVGHRAVPLRQDQGPASALSGYPEFMDPEMNRALLAGEARATPEGRKVLETGRRMSVVDRVIIQGACWDYADAIYQRAGFAGKKRSSVFSHAKRGPYAPAAAIQPGDFLSFMKYESADSVHSAIFVEWLPREGDRFALMLTYPGGRIPVPVHYGIYHLDRVYHVVRPRR
jgi:hypothetical protein